MPGTLIHVKMNLIYRDLRKMNVDIDPFYSAVNQAHLINAIQQLNEGKGSAHELIEKNGAH